MTFWEKIKALFGFRKKEADPISLSQPGPVTVFHAAPQPTPEPEDILTIALDITPKFEGKGYGQVTGDFDKQGLSLGILQWCLGMGSLQKEILTPYVTKHGSIDKLGIFPMGVDHLARASVSESLKFCRAHMLNGKLVKPEWKAAWTKFLLLDEVVKIQFEAAKVKKLQAEAVERFLGLQSLRAFCWAFDIVVQNGSMKDVNLLAPSRLNAKRELMQFEANGPGVDDFKKNRVIWIDMLDTAEMEQVSLLRTTIARTKLANPSYTADVINRKGSIAMGKGWVHGQLYKFPQLETRSESLPSPSIPVSDELHHALANLADMVGVPRVQIDRLVSFQKQRYPGMNARYWAAIDFSKHSSTKRLFVFDVREKSVAAYLCAHGKGSEGERDDGFPEKFSNVPGSNCTSLGICRAAERYHGKHGLSLRLDGLEATNSNMRQRAVVLHGADYVSPEFIERTGRLGRTDGCFGVENKYSAKLVDQLENGSLIIAFN